MKLWKTVALSTALAGAAAAGAASTPVVHGQSRAPRVTAPVLADVFTIGGGSRLGVSIRDIDGDETRTKGAPAGVIIDSVDDDSPAAKAGLKHGDVVVEFDGERVRSVRQFTRLVSETPAGRNVSASIMRDGSRQTISVTPRDGSNLRFLERENIAGLEGLREFGTRPPAMMARPVRPVPTPATPVPPPAFDSFIWRSGSRLGITTGDLSPQLRDYFGAKEGVLVSSVEDGSAAAKAGVKAGDVVTSINGQTVQSPADVRRELGRIDTGEEFSIGVVRDKKATTLKGTLTESPDRRRTGRAIV
ncbi:MAG: PDZ domain-containing protein [Vicinamibacterales bacterium]